MLGSTAGQRAGSASRLAVDIYPDAEHLAQAVAALVVEEAQRAADARGRFTIALAGGATPRRSYELLAGPPLVDAVPWGDVHVFWTDERCVAPGDPRSNQRMARRALLDHVPVPPGHVHPMTCDAGVVGSMDAARRHAEEYELLLRSLFAGTEPVTSGLDLVLLGLGADGHTASLFPGSPALLETDRWVAPVFVDAATGAGTTGAGEDLWRITLTASFINAAAAVVFLVTGPAKAAAVREILEGPADTARLPAQLIRPRRGTLRWCLDDDSAALLKTRPGRS